MMNYSEMQYLAGLINDSAEGQTKHLIEAMDCKCTHDKSFATDHVGMLYVKKGDIIKCNRCLKLEELTK